MWRLPWLLPLLLLCGAQEAHQGAMTTPPHGATSSPVGATPIPAGTAQFPGNATPSPASATPSPVRATLSPGDATPSPGGATPSPPRATTYPARATPSPAGGPQRSPPHGSPTAAPLEEEADQQGSIISQLLGDYDKVKTFSSGSDCVCRCVVRPMRRADCGHVHAHQASAHDHYTVETISKGSDCKKCVCTAPPSAVDPCEGEYRLKRLQEASKDDIKLATILDLLEGSLYGMDLLKLHSVTTKLLARVDNMEKALARNFSDRAREKDRMKEKAKEKEKKTQQKKKKTNDLEGSVQKSRAAVYANKQKKYDSQLKLNPQRDQLVEPIRNKTASRGPMGDKMEPKTSIREKSSVVIRGVTFYKAEEEGYIEEEEEATFKRKEKTSVPPSKPPTTEAWTTSGRAWSSQRSTAAPSTIQATTSSPSTFKAASTAVSVGEKTTAAGAGAETVTSPSSTPLATQQRSTLASESSVTPPTVGPRSGKSPLLPRSRLSWTESPADQPKTTRKPGVCKDTLASISEPVQQNFYGLRDGAWMRDARGHGSVIYLTNGHYGSNLQEFRDLQTFKSGQPSNSYKLPYSFTGTGHVVYNGAFFYNRAFSRDVIRYDLRHRYVAAWSTLHDSLLEEQASNPQSEVQFAVDESGLWLLYPALDSEGFHQEVILLIQVSPRDLQPIQTFRTGLRRGRYGNSFLVCGVLYAVDSMERHHANVTYAFDTHTLTHTMPSLAFVNTHAHTSQLAYCPLDKRLYAWDDGHQMTYDVVFAY